MSPDDYIRQFGGAAASRRAVAMAGPVPENVTDGRDWGGEWEAYLSGAAGVHSAEAAARVSAIYFCVSIIAEAVGSLQNGFVDAQNQPVSVTLSDVIGLEPNPLMTAAEFWSAMAFTAALRGVAFAEPTVGLDNVELWPLDPRATSVTWKDRSFSVSYSADGLMRTFVPQQLFWFSGLADATAKPLVPWRQAQPSAEFDMALQVGARTFFKNNMRFSGILSTDQKLTEDGIGRIRKGIARWRNGGIPVLEQGLTFKEAQGTNSDAQTAELIKQRTAEMARYWHIPRSMYSEDPAAAGSQEQEALGFVKWVMRPWTRRIEQAVTVRALPPDMKAAGIRARFNLDSLLRGDSATQWRNAVLARTASVLSIDEIRTGWFNLPAYDEPWSRDPRAPLNSNRAADTATGGQTAPQDTVAQAILAQVSDLPPQEQQAVLAALMKEFAA